MPTYTGVWGANESVRLSSGEEGASGPGDTITGLASDSALTVADMPSAPVSVCAWRYLAAATEILAFPLSPAMFAVSVVFPNDTSTVSEGMRSLPLRVCSERSAVGSVCNDVP